MKGEQEQIKKAAEQLGTKVKERDTPDNRVKMSLARVVKKGATAKEMLGLTDAMVEGIYGQAYRLYNTGKFREANQLFRLLIMINPTESKYVMGLAAGFHMLKEYKSAADCYQIVGVIDPQNPIPLYHSSDCYLQMGDPASALISLQMAVKRSGDKPEFKILKDRALMTIESLQKDINKAMEKLK
jgi:type III secretion system low calcium response chaperone LcrH/SycD